MRHRRKIRHFGRKHTAVKALLRGLVVSIVEHGRITTTVDKAKELRRHVEKAITLGKKNDLASRRLLLSRYPNQATVATIMDDLAPRFKTRKGGYTRIIKIGRRPGDTAEMAFIEFVDYDFEGKGQPKAKDAAEATPADKKAKPKKAAKAGGTAIVAKKKVAAKKQQKKSRAAARA